MSGSDAVRAGTVLLDGMPATGGVHCETTALGALLNHAGLPLSEPMLFGLGAGLSFVYWDSTRQPMPFLGGRVKPFELTRNLARRLRLDLRVQETRSARRAWTQVRDVLDAGAPVGLQLDSFDLDYFTTRVHFAGHVVAMYGYDTSTAYLLDTAQQGGRVRTGLESLARARAARGPMAAPGRSFTLGDFRPPALAPAVVAAIKECAEAFLVPPIANLGHRGITTTARRIPSWFERVDDPAHDLPQLAALMERGGTGGALFRNLYRDFLSECLPLLEPARADLVARGRDGIAAAAVLWTEVAALIERAGRTGDTTALAEAAAVLHRIADVETAAMETLRRL